MEGNFAQPQPLRPGFFSKWLILIIVKIGSLESPLSNDGTLAEDTDGGLDDGHQIVSASEANITNAARDVAAAVPELFSALRLSRQECGDLRLVNVELGRRNEVLKQALRKQSNKGKELQGLLQTVTAELFAEKQRNVAESSIISDETMIAKWRNLDYAVKNFCAKFLKNIHLDQCTIPTAFIDKFMSVSNNYQTYLASSELRDDFFRALIWKVLGEKLLSCPFRGWDGDLSTAALRLGNSDAWGQKYHEWRVQTAILLEQQQDHCSSESHTNGLADVLWGWVRVFVQDDSGDCDVMIRDLNSKAIQLARMICKSKQNFMPMTIKDNYGAEALASDLEEAGEIEQIRFRQDGGDVVDLDIAPALWKAGDIRGEHYEKKICLVGATVGCTTSRTMHGMDDTLES